MKLKREWILLLVVILIYYLDYITDVGKDGWELSRTPIRDAVFVLSHTSLFLLINFVLIKKYFYTERYILFVLGLVGLLCLYGIIEEGVLEKWLLPRSRGRDAVSLRNILVFGGEIIVPMLAFATVKLMNDNFEKEKRLEQIRKDNLSNELKLLRSQIQPHVLFNSLNNIYNFTLSKSDEAPELILKLSNVLRYITYETAVEKVPLQKELAFISDYVDLQKMQYDHRGDILYFITGANHASHLSVAPFILIPFIENSFKHSFGTKINDVVIDINVEITGSDLLLIVTNNFEQALDDKESLTVGGIGLQNVQQRLDLLYPDRYMLSSDIKDNLYMAKLLLRLIP